VTVGDSFTAPAFPSPELQHPGHPRTPHGVTVASSRGIAWPWVIAVSRAGPFQSLGKQGRFVGANIEGQSLIQQNAAWLANHIHIQSTAAASAVDLAGSDLRF